jgi:hypothetical protein
MSIWGRYKLRWRRRRLLLRAFRKRHELSLVLGRTDEIEAQDILLFSTMRNEMLRLPHFLDHYRQMGVAHFLIVDNGSDDGTAEYLAAQPDVSLWHSGAGYKASRFGMDWLTWLQRRHAHGHWTLTVDADELLIYPGHPHRPLAELTSELDALRLSMLGAVMLDLYPKGPVEAQRYDPGQDPVETLPWFDPAGYRSQVQKKLCNLWLQGGPRDRLFFRQEPKRAPTLNKIPLVKWHRSYVYVNSTHTALPILLNRTFDPEPDSCPSGVLLHTKFLPGAAERAATERARGQHFSNSALYDDYYAALTNNPNFWCETSVRFSGWQQLVDLGLMRHGAFRAAPDHAGSQEDCGKTNIRQ